MTSDEAQDASSRETTGFWSSVKYGTVLLGGVALLAVGLLMVVLVLPAWMISLFQSNSCSPIGQQQLAAQEGFVRQHLPQASDFDVATYDCDSGDIAHLGFITELTPVGARDAFLSDSACTAAETSEPDAAAANCRSASATMEIYFDRALDGRTNGYLEFRT